MKIKQIMKTNIISVKEDTSIIEAIKVMKLNDVGFLIIFDDNQNIKGVTTDRDILLYLDHQEKLTYPINRIMKKNVITVTSSMNIIEASEIMGYYQIKRLVVVDDFGKVAGVLTLRDLANNDYTLDYALNVLAEISFGKDNETFVIQNDNSLSTSIILD